MTVLNGKTIRLRAPEPEDLEVLYIWENDPQVWQISNTLIPFSRYTLRQYIETAHLDIYEAKQVRFMIERMDPLIPVGSIDLYDFDPLHGRAGVGILIGAEDQRNKGFAAEALDLLISYGFETLMLHQLFCSITEDNLHSIQLFTKKGFIPCGEKKEWIKTSRGWKNELSFQLIGNTRS